MLRIFGLLILCASALSAQIKVSYQVQGPLVMKKITGGVRVLKGYRLYQVIAYNTGTAAVALDSGPIYMAAQKSGIATVGPDAARFVLERSEAWHPYALALRVVGQWAVPALAFITSRKDDGILSDRAKLFLPYASQGASLAAQKLEGRAPNFAWLNEGLLKGTLGIPAGGSQIRYILAIAGPDEPTFADIGQ